MQLPTESALLVLVLLSIHEARNMLKLLPFFLIYIGVDRISTVASLLRGLLVVYIHLLAIGRVANLLDGKFDPADL